MPKNNPICQARIYGEPPFAFCQTRHHRHHLKNTRKSTFLFFPYYLFVCQAVRRFCFKKVTVVLWPCDSAEFRESSCGFRPRLKSSTPTWKRVTDTYTETLPYRYNFPQIFRESRSPRHDIWLRLLSLSPVSLLVSEKEVKCRKMFRAAIISSRDIYSACGSRGART